MGLVLAAISYDPLVHIEIGPLSISPHGLGIAVGFLLGARLMLPATRRRGIGDDDVYALLTWAAIGAIVGARLAYFLNHYGEYDSPLDVFRVWEGGISLLGGFFGAILFALPEVRKRKLDFWKLMDAAAPGMALGVVIGRIGDLIVADHLGKPTDFFLGYECPPPGVETASPCLGDVVHQTALYDFLMTSVLLVVLLYLRKRKRYDGFLITVFGAWYGVQRVIEDFLREDTRHLGDTLTGSQITAIVTIAVCVWHLGFVRHTPRWGHWEENAEPDADAVPDDLVETPTMASPPAPEGEQREREE
ncbi:MAG: prolipoprotein diacylglyceryl transferase [Actinobacteria bacterium]|nr:prolipoprotein diacylglyceryl transferase [Actinomycetota bacterium]